MTFWFSSEAVTCYYQSNHAKVEAIMLSALPKDTTSELARPTFTLSIFYTERQAGKLWIRGVGRKISRGGWATGKTRPKK